MISRLRGRIVSVHPECIVDVGGVGFELIIPEKDRESISPDDRDAAFYTYLYVREDRLNLFGFLHAEDRALFLRMIEVSGVGPKVALGMMATHPTARIVDAIRANDVGFLKTLPGIGKKTAERIAMELADKLDDFAPATASASVPTGGVRDEVMIALTSLGMTRGAAEMAIDKLDWPAAGEASVEELVKEALRYAAGR